MSAVNAGGLSQAWLHWCREAALRVRSHISPGPYRSFRELSLAGSVDPDIWCPPTFVGNSGIERFNGICGFALFFAAGLLRELVPTPVIPRESGVSSTPRLRGSIASALEYWIARFSRAMTAEDNAACQSC